ncbi:hypothetical protein UXN85_20705 [Enterobacter hormaechei]
MYIPFWSLIFVAIAAFIFMRANKAKDLQIRTLEESLESEKYIGTELRTSWEDAEKERDRARDSLYHLLNLASEKMNQPGLSDATATALMELGNEVEACLEHVNFPEKHKAPWKE